MLTQTIKINDKIISIINSIQKKFLFENISAVKQNSIKKYLYIYYTYKTFGSNCAVRNENIERQGRKI